MSRLYGLARRISEYARLRYQKQYRDADEFIERKTGGTYDRSRRGTYTRIRDLLFGSGRQHDRHHDKPPPRSVTPPPIEPPPITPTSPPAPPRPSPPGSHPDDDEVIEDLREFLLGRDASYDQDDFDAVMEGMRRVESSNVYSFYFERESRMRGIMYVTFLDTLPNGARSGPGPTYAYYDVPVAMAIRFRRQSSESAGKAVWDIFRIRGTVWGHQYTYRLVHISGEYVPRKATRDGFKARAVPTIGTGRRSFRRNTLSPVSFSRGGSPPNRGGPNRGGPNRGRP